MTQWWAPTVVRVSGDSTMRGQLLETTDGELLSNFPERMVLIANHQIYTDWLYLWWMGYTAGMHGRIYVVLKESLKNIPVLGWGMQFAQFIFLKRKWEDDKPRLAAHMQKFNNSGPMWLMIFPEGTNLATCTREASRKWAEKNKIKDLQHMLLPRSTGLHFMLKELQDTVDYVYDCTIAYEGVPRGQYAQDIFTVGASYFGGRPPKSVNMYWRRFRVADIPLNDPKKFEIWLRARWSEKDRFVEHYYRKGRFPADTGSTKDHTGRTLAGAGYIETAIKPKRWYEFLQVFAPIGLFSLVLYLFYGSLPQDMVNKIKSIDQKTIVDNLNAIQKGELKVPETQDIIATAPEHLQNRFDAVRKIAEARDTTPEKVIAQLQTLSDGAPATEHLQNRFDAVRKIAEARGTTPEKVIAQLQTHSDGKANETGIGNQARGRKSAGIPKLQPKAASQTPGIAKLNTAAPGDGKKTASQTPGVAKTTMAPGNVKKAASQTSGNAKTTIASGNSKKSADQAPGNASTTMAPRDDKKAASLGAIAPRKLAPKPKTNLAGQANSASKGQQPSSTTLPLGTSVTSKTPTAITRSAPKPKADQPAQAKVPIANRKLPGRAPNVDAKTNKPLATGKEHSSDIAPANSVTTPSGKASRDEEIRKARKKLAIRQGKDEPKRKTRRTVEASLSQE